MKIAIVGSRDFSPLKMVSDYIDTLPMDSTIVSGGARGVDRTAEVRARHRGLSVMIFPADWEKHGRSAGYRRNVDIINAADRVVAFWNGCSRGTKHSIDLSRTMNKEIHVIQGGGV